jgi:excisionase family DNA binding protein
MNSDDRFLTTQQAAEKLGLSASTIKRLVESNELTAVKTPGGHRRISESTLHDYAKSRGMNFHELTATSTVQSTSTGKLRPVNESLEYWQTALKSALVNSHLEEARHAVKTVYASEGNAYELGDKLISPVMSRIGHAWQDGRLEIFQEHHACQLLSDILFDLVRLTRARNRRLDITGSAPLAIGSTPEGDHYTLTGLLCELCLLECGWNVRNLGSHLPLIEFAQAVTELKPKIAWLSVHHLEDEAKFLTGARRLFETCRAMKTVLVVGGNGLTPRIQTEFQQLGIPLANQLIQLVELSDSIFPEGRRAIDSLANFS